MMNHPGSIWTIGHSTHPIGEFIEILKSFGISLLVDIRSLPGSRAFPQFNKEALEITLPESGIRYLHMKDLGGRRKVKKDSRNTAWRHLAFRGYADYMETTEFQEAAQHLEKLALEQLTAIMCSEVLWWRCHRSLVSDWLKVNGWKVFHITGKYKSEEHPYTKPARIVDGKVRYGL